MKLIRKYIRALLEDKGRSKDSAPDDLLTEPDDPEINEEEKEVEQEASAGGVAGVSVPLGGGPSYPKKTRKKRKSPTEAAGKSFGNAKPIKK